MTTIPENRDVFASIGIANLLATVTVSTCTAGICNAATTNMFGFGTYKSNLLNTVSCSVPTNGQHVVDCTLPLLRDYTINQDETITFGALPINLNPRVLRSAMVFTIVGSGMLTIKKTVGYVTVTPTTVTEEQVRAGVWITYELFGDQFATNPLPGLAFRAFSGAPVLVETDTGTMPRGFLAINANSAFGVGSMFASQTMDGTMNSIINAPLATKLKMYLQNPSYDCHATESDVVTLNDAAIKSVGYMPTTTNAVLSITPTKGTLTMMFTSPSQKTLGELTETEIRQGGLVIVLQFNLGESFVGTEAGLFCLYDAWQPLQKSAEQTASFFQKKTELINPTTAIALTNNSMTATYTFGQGLTYNTKGADVVKFDIFAYTKACIRSGIVPTFIQGGSRSNVMPQFQISDGNPLVSWADPAEYSAGTYTAVVTEADVRAGLRLGITLVGDVWTPAAPAPWLTTGIFLTNGIASLPAVSAPIFAALTSSSASINSAASAVDDTTKSLFTIKMAALPLYNIVGTDTVLIAIPAAQAGSASFTYLSWS